MCFSPQGDVVGGIAIVAIGLDACRHLRSRREYLLVAALPIVLARLCADGFTSLWCIYAAIASAAIALHLRITDPVRPLAAPPLRSGPPQGAVG